MARTIFIPIPIYNAGEGLGDIAEINARRKWKTLNIWVSDTAVKVGLPVNVSGQLTRNEYIYLGRTTAGTLNVTNITVQGADAARVPIVGVYLWFDYQRGLSAR
jgi:hypothetical protein